MAFEPATHRKLIKIGAGRDRAVEICGIEAASRGPLCGLSPLRCPPSRHLRRQPSQTAGSLLLASRWKLSRDSGAPNPAFVTRARTETVKLSARQKLPSYVQSLNYLTRMELIGLKTPLSTGTRAPAPRGNSARSFRRCSLPFCGRRMNVSISPVQATFSLDVKAKPLVSYATCRNERPNRSDAGSASRDIERAESQPRPHFSGWIETDLRPRDFRERLSSVSSAASDRENHTSVVWRSCGSLDCLPAVLSGRSAARIFLLASAFAHFLSEDSKPNSRRAAWCESFRVADSAESIVETDRRGKSHAPHFVVACAHRGTPLLSALVNQPAAAIVVRGHANWGVSLPLLRALQCWIRAGSTELSGPGRAVRFYYAPGDALVHCLCSVRDFVRGSGALRSRRKHGERNGASRSAISCACGRACNCCGSRSRRVGRRCCSRSPITSLKTSRLFRFCG